ncbi:MAG TPA: hypothetical protein VFU36_13790 [Jatrophihabitans sp.]|nr:hypothetical protein [Jatrophihabitans sp.]
MRSLRLTCLLAMLLLLAGCASTGSTSAGGGSTSGGSTSGGPIATPPHTVDPSGSPSGSASRQPGPAPSDSDGLQISGPIAVSLLSRTGPVDPAGPYLGKDVTDLLGRYRAALAGRQPSCQPAGCWSDAKVPAGSLLLAVRPTLVACYQVQRIQTARDSASAIRLDLQLNYVCRPGMGSAARMAGWLIAVPATAAAGNRLTVTVRVSLRPGTAFGTLGSATL